jgi:hypothetical protein
MITHLYEYSCQGCYCIFYLQKQNPKPLCPNCGKKLNVSYNSHVSIDLKILNEINNFLASNKIALEEVLPECQKEINRLCEVEECNEIETFNELEVYAKYLKEIITFFNQ